jgi:hypothetical protein
MRVRPGSFVVLVLQEVRWTSYDVAFVKFLV